MILGRKVAFVTDINVIICFAFIVDFWDIVIWVRLGLLCILRNMSEV